MTRDEAVAIIKGRLKRTSDTALDATIVTEMKFVQSTLLEGAPTLPWFLVSDNVTLTTVASNELVATPTDVGSVTGRDFIREIEETDLWLYDADNSSAPWQILKKEDFDFILSKYPSDVPATPKMYTLEGDNFRLRPVPDAIYTLRTRCYLREPPLTSNIENGWLKYAADLLISETAMIIAASYLRDEEIVQMVSRDVQAARARLFKVNTARKYANRNLLMGGED